MHIIVAVGFVMVLICLAASGFFMLRNSAKNCKKNTADSNDEQNTPSSLETQHQIDRNRRMARALGWRVAISAILFCFVLLSWQMSWLTPNVYQG